MAMHSPFITRVFRQLLITLTKLLSQRPNQLLANEPYSHDTNIHHINIKRKKKKSTLKSNTNTQIKNKKKLKS